MTMATTKRAQQITTRMAEMFGGGSHEVSHTNLRVLDHIGRVLGALGYRVTILPSQNRDFVEIRAVNPHDVRIYTILRMYPEREVLILQALNGEQDDIHRSLETILTNLPHSYTVIPNYTTHGASTHAKQTQLVHQAMARYPQFTWLTGQHAYVILKRLEQLHHGGNPVNTRVSDRSNYGVQPGKEIAMLGRDNPWYKRYQYGAVDAEIVDEPEPGEFSSRQQLPQDPEPEPTTTTPPRPHGTGIPQRGFSRNLGDLGGSGLGYNVWEHPPHPKTTPAPKSGEERLRQTRRYSQWPLWEPVIAPSDVELRVRGASPGYTTQRRSEFVDPHLHQPIETPANRQPFAPKPASPAELLSNSSRDDGRFSDKSHRMLSRDVPWGDSHPAVLRVADVLSNMGTVHRRDRKQGGVYLNTSDGSNQIILTLKGRNPKTGNREGRVIFVTANLQRFREFLTLIPSMILTSGRGRDSNRGLPIKWKNDFTPLVQYVANNAPQLYPELAMVLSALHQKNKDGILVGNLNRTGRAISRTKY